MRSVTARPWADGVCGSADSVWRPLSGDFSNATLRGRVEIVVSHCSVPLAWLDGDIAALAARGVDVARVSVYSKCGGGGDVGLKFEPAVVYDYDNVGRCDHSYAVHLAEAYDSLEDVTLFTKDSFRSQPRRRRRELADVVAGAAAHGFGCGVGSEASDWYDGPTLRAWTIPKYRKAWDQNRGRRPRSGGFASPQFRALGAWLESVVAVGLARGAAPDQRAHAASALSRAATPVCLGGTFAATRDGARSLGAEGWRAVARSLDVRAEPGDEERPARPVARQHELAVAQRREDGHEQPQTAEQRLAQVRVDVDVAVDLRREPHRPLHEERDGVRARPQPQDRRRPAQPRRPGRRRLLPVVVHCCRPRFRAHSC